MKEKITRVKLISQVAHMNESMGEIMNTFTAVRNDNDE
jgi:hypothetical protein